LFSVVGRPVPLPVVGDISANSAAAEAGLKTGDTILAIDGHKMADFEDVRRVVMVNAGHRLSLDIARAGQTLTIPVLIKPAARGDMSVGRLGVTSGGVKYVHLWPGAALVAGITETGQMFGQIFGGLVHIVTTGSGVGDLGGPIAVVILSGQVARQGIAALVSFTAFLSINLGLVNLLPIPVLDGGHLMFYAAEAIRGRPLPARALDYGFRVGFALIASLFVFLSINDVVKHTGALHWVAHLLGAAS
jgi:regulator of sigma E protease